MKVCGNPDSGLLVIQAMDARQLERLEDEVRALQDMGGALPLWARLRWRIGTMRFLRGPRRPCSAGTALADARKKRWHIFKTR